MELGAAKTNPKIALGSHVGDATAEFSLFTELFASDRRPDDFAFTFAKKVSSLFATCRVSPELGIVLQAMKEFSVLKVILIRCGGQARASCRFL